MLFTIPANASVVLFTTPSSVNVKAGDSFNILVKMSISGLDSVTGIDYYLHTPLSSDFNIISRYLTGSQFSDPIKDNLTVISPIFGLTGVDLGASLANVSIGVTAGDYVLSTYTIQTRQGMALGNYELKTISMPGTGWVGTQPLFNELEFSSHTGTVVSIIAVPEPSGILFITIASMFLGRSRR